MSSDLTKLPEGRALICVHGGKPHPKGDDCVVPTIPDGSHLFVLQRHWAAPYLNAGYTSPQRCGRCDSPIGHKGWQLEPCYGTDRDIR